MDPGAGRHRRSSCFDVGAEQRVQFNPQSFTSADQLGSFIETNLHGCFHEMAATAVQSAGAE